MENILDELNQVPGILGSLIIGKDGLVIVSLWDTEADIDMVGADSADVFGVCESMMSEKLNFGMCDMLTIESEEAKVVLKNIDESTFLTVILSKDVNLGLVRLEIKNAAEKLKEVL